jgi:hypothetical protein
MALSKIVFSGRTPEVVAEGVASANAVTSSRTQLTIRAKKLFAKSFGMQVNASRGLTVPRSLPITEARWLRNHSACP